VVLSEAHMETNHGYKDSKPWLSRQPVVTMPTGIELVGDRPLPRDLIGGTSMAKIS